MQHVRTVLVLACLGVMALVSTSNAHAQTVTTARQYRVLLVGNSLTYTNNLPALLRAVGASQGTPIVTETWVAPDGTLAERWRDGHVADALRARKFDAVVLQEMGGLAGCLASASQQRKAPCAASTHAHEEFSRLATAHGAKTLLLTTWARDARGQARIDRGMRQLAVDTGATLLDGAAAIESMRKSQPSIRPYPDGTHPSTQASLMLAVALYRGITGTVPVARDLRVTAPLLPVNAAVSGSSALETQAALAGAGQVTVVPASLVAPLVNALPTLPASGEVDPPGRRR